VTRLSVVIPSWNTRELLRGCLCALERALPSSSEVIVIDNASRDGTGTMVSRDFQHVRLLRNEHNEGFARAVNQGFERTRGDYVLILQADTELWTTSLNPLVAFLDANERYGAVVPRVLNTDGSVQPTVRGMPRWSTPLWEALRRWYPEAPELLRSEASWFDYGGEADIECAAGVCLLVRRKALSRTEPLDEKLGLFFSDVDLGRRLRESSWRMHYLPEVQLFHHGGRSLAQLSGADALQQRSRLTYYRKHHGRFAGDWVKFCAGVAFADELVAELWRRANGHDEVPLGPVYQSLTGCLRS
jgi:hypothetical protein